MDDATQFHIHIYFLLITSERFTGADKTKFNENELCQYDSCWLGDCWKCVQNCWHTKYNDNKKKWRRERKNDDETSCREHKVFMSNAVISLLSLAGLGEIRMYASVCV